MTKILFISGSIGLGHVTRDIEIAREIRKVIPGVEISWLAGHPATTYLEASGENLLPEAEHYASDSTPAEKAAKPGFQLNLSDYVSNAAPEWEQNQRIFKQVIRDREFDLIVGDETYEIFGGLLEQSLCVNMPFVAIFDFFGKDAITTHPLEMEEVYDSNLYFWTQFHRLFLEEKKKGIFIGELDDIPDKSLGPDLPDRREYAKGIFDFVGYILQFDPKTLSNKGGMRRELGYGDETLVICSIGGTSVGKELLDLCGQAFEIAKQKVAKLRMILVSGPRLTAESLSVPSGVEVREYVPALYKHFAASDLAIVQGGGTTTLELTALNRPFIYFPLEAHYEQQIHVAHRLRRHRAGVRLSYSQVTAESLAKAMTENLEKPVDYLSIPLDGASRTAQLVRKMLG